MAIFTYPPVSVDTTGLASEATLLQVESNTADTVTELQSANTELQSVNAELSSQTTILNSIDGKLNSPVAVSGPLTDAELRASAVPVSAASLPLPAGAATETTLASVQTAANALEARVAGSLTPVEHDELVITYVGAGNGQGEISTVTYKLASSTVATLTFSYDANDKLTGVVRS